MADFGQRADPAADSTCYRHPDRRSFVLCQRCTRTICGDCQTPAPVGVVCPACVAEARGAQSATRPSMGVRVRRAGSSGAPVVTLSIIGLTLLVFVAQQMTGDAVGRALGFAGVFVDLRAAPYVAFQPWRAVTVSLAHAGILHVGFNMLTLWLFGRVLEPLYGRLRFSLVWAVSALGGSLGVVAFGSIALVVGASGALFGLFGAYFVVMRQARMNPTSLLVLIGINIVFGFVVPGVAWEAHVGGLLAGMLAGWLVGLDLRSPTRRTRGVLLVAALGLFLLAATVVWASAIAPSSVVVSNGALT